MAYYSNIRNVEVKVFPILRLSARFHASLELSNWIHHRLALREPSFRKCRHEKSKKLLAGSRFLAL